MKSDIPPKISILMSVHNGMPFLYEALESIKTQTYADWECIIIDDASTDTSAEVLTTYASEDSRFRIERNSENSGLTHSLNRALSLARGSLIARCDADDVLVPTRLTQQAAFLDTHPEVGLCGSWYTCINASGQHLQTMQPPTTHAALHWTLCRMNPFCHSSIMMRREALDAAGKTYAPDCPCAQDYELWTRMATVTHMATIPEVLVHYRLHENTVGVRKRDTQRHMHRQIMERAITAWLKETPRQEAVDAAFCAQFHLPQPSGSAMISATKMMQTAYQRFLRECHDSHDRDEATRKQARFLFDMGWENRTRHPLACIRCLAQATRTHPMVALEALWRWRHNTSLNMPANTSTNAAEKRADMKPADGMNDSAHSIGK